MELQILHWFESLHNPVLDAIMYGITFLGDKGWFWIALSLAFLVIPVFKKDRKLGMAMLFGLVLSVIFCNGIMKNLVARPRPFWAEGATPDNPIISNEFGENFYGIFNVFKGIDDWSFPSGHTSASFAAAWAIILWDRKKGIPAMILAALIAVSRMYLNVHFPSDVAVSLVLGSIYGIIGFFITKVIMKKSEKFNGLMTGEISYKGFFSKEK